MADNQPTTSDQCEHGKKHAECVECNPIFKDEAMTMPGFHYVTVTGDADRQPTVTIEMQDVTTDPRFLGEPPVQDEDCECSFCGTPWVGEHGEHWDDDLKEYVSARDFHRFGMADRVEGFFSDELTVSQR